MNGSLESNSPDIVPATPDEAEFIDNKIVAFNQKAVPFTQEQTPIFKNYI